MKRYKSEALEALHGFMGDLYKAGGISEERMREFDNACLVKPAASVQTARREPAKIAESENGKYRKPAIEPAGRKECAITV